ncbi:hypothetical protein M514_04122 [Trichuris suis]|uniref:MPN domain-containing protein n=1 Tax=Trichuris suis TaxID=68888 RepID=A0A085MCJ4_9BILA|nr:hypothetical protein M513_04122 [Trichuris suis]KFD68417.1 hypothetical protein M514_04122 [Trichuris suis]KHJ47685.1 hypothetical protein D918_01841 [Trichuris suis]
MAEVGLSYLALAKVILHAAKYPHCCVNGFLIGHRVDKGRRVRIVDAVPLLHRWQVLTPMTELALIQVSTACSFDTNSKLQIVGYYQANEQLEDETPGTVAEELGEKIMSQFSDAVLIVLRNSALVSISDLDCLKVYSFVDSRWQPKNSNLIFLDNSRVSEAAIRSCLKEKLYRSLTDFDDHLENVSLDFWNTKLNEQLEAVL